MNPEDWSRLESVFFAALDLPPEQRAAFLDERCAGDSAFRAEVEAVLSSHVRAGGAPEADPPVTEGQSESELDAGLHEGRLVGPYRLEERIGRGGMGEVYRAQRVDDQYRQEVAVKLIRASLPAEEMVRRFRIERQVLARLQHPNVAPLLDGGVTEDGHPYLVMQYVRGVPITDYADTRTLTVAARLNLFATVCRAVHYAHSNLVVHRDLKPSNILVTEDGQVRLLDFGIAKILDPEGMGITAPITEDHLLLTPEHAAPEQILGDPITTATDVYALGILLYELLTGTRPFRATMGGGWHRAVCEEEAARPSSAFITLASGPVERDAATVARSRGSRVGSLQQQLRGDLDHIALMALRKEPERRYASAEQFAEDIDRYLEGRPVLARRDTLGYRSRKFLRRNRLAASIAAALMLTLIGATGVSAYQSRARAVALAQAEAERDKAESLAAFMLSVFEANDPASAQGRTVTARELLDQAAERIERVMRDQPLVSADLEIAIGRAYSALGLFEVAQPLYEDALRQRRAHLPEEDLEVAAAIDQVGRGLAALGRFEEARPLMRDALARRERLLGPTDTLVASTLTALARTEIELGAYDTAQALVERAVAIHREQEVPDERGLADALRFLWLVLNWQGETDRVLPVATEALTVASNALAEGDPFLQHVTQDYALALESVGELDSAVAVHRRVLEIYRRVEGPDHVDLSYSYHNLGRLYQQLGRTEEALDAYQQGLDIRERALGADHPLVSAILHSYAIALAGAEEFERAAQLEERAVPIQEAAYGERHENTLNSMEFLAQLHAVLHRYEDSIAMLETLVERGWANPVVFDGWPFKPIEDDARFQRLREEVRNKVPAAP